MAVSSSIPTPAVVSISPVMAAFAPRGTPAVPGRGSRPRPPARRISAFGRRKRKTAAARHTSSLKGGDARRGGCRGWIQHIERDGTDPQFPQFQRQIHLGPSSVSPSPQNAAAAHCQSGFAARPGWCEACRRRCGWCRRRGKAAGGFQIVVIPGDARRFQGAKLFKGQQPVGGAERDTARVPHPAVAFAQCGGFPVAQTAAGGDHRIPQHPLAGVVCRALQQPIPVQQGIALHPGGVMAGLSAVAAILRTPAAFTVDDGAQVEAVPAEVRPQLVRRLKSVLGSGVRRRASASPRVGIPRPAPCAYRP